jgi:ubiquinone/menaquinone biosynthesis C-methylase UbiE
LRESWEYYSEIASRYDYMYEEPYWNLYHRIVERLLEDHVKTIGRTLDIGTGTGRWALYLAEKAHEVVGVDLSQEMLSVASMKAGLADLKIDFVHSNAERLPFEKECFDYVLAMGDLLSYAKNTSEVLAECQRVLKRGGLLLATVDNAWAFLHDFLSRGEYSLAKRLVEKDKIPIGDSSVSSIVFATKPFFPEEIGHLLNMNGFDLIDISSVVAFYPYDEQALAAKIDSAVDWELKYCRNRETLARSEHLFLCGKKR